MMVWEEVRLYALVEGHDEMVGDHDVSGDLVKWVLNHFHFQ